MTAKKVAILGGGMSSLTTAFELTRPELAGMYDVTVYQMGWRLGGKGASGRNAKYGNRIEEHGLHIWMGFYENAFSVMRAAYAEMGRTEGPLQTWEDAFKKHSYIVLEEWLGERWYEWAFDFPTNDLVPGDDGALPSAWDHLVKLLEMMGRFWMHSSLAALGAFGTQTSPWAHRLDEAVDAVERVSGVTLSAVNRVAGAVFGGARKVAAAAIAHPLTAHFERILEEAKTLAAHDIGAQLDLARAIREVMGAVWALLHEQIETNLEAHKLWIALNLTGSAIVGMLEDRVASAGWDSIDGLDLRAWLRKSGANQVTLDSAPMRGIYDLVFGYFRGNVKDGQFAAGTAMRGILRMLFTYKGAIFYKMQAGMGDVVFTPLYEVLRKRGVKFAFFHRITNLRLGPGGDAVEAIEAIRQVDLKASEYAPLVDVAGLPCWPSAPLFDQIVDGDELEASGINLESAWAKPWKGSRPIELVKGRDFDEVVIGMSIAALPYACGELAAKNRRFQEMLDKVATVQTCAFQLWLKPDLAGLGWKDPPGVTELPVLGAFVEPLDTWADMSQLLCRETWRDVLPVGHEPRDCAYFCGPLDQPKPIPNFDDHGFPARELARLDAMVTEFLDRDVGRLWPKTVTPTGFQWDLLVDPRNRPGEARLASQYRRVNVDPTERYVLSVPGSTSYRLRAEESGFSNVFLTGDWTYNGMNAGCIEASVMAGMMTARAMSGVPRVIVGEETVAEPPAPPSRRAA